MRLNETSSVSSFTIAGGTVTLDGGGNLDMTNYTQHRIRGSDNATLVNVDNTIQGGGRIDSHFHNQGTVNADNAALYVAGSSIVNDGLMQASPGGTLSVQTGISGTGSWQADGGSILVHSGTGVTTTGNVDVLNNGYLSISGRSMSAGDFSIDGSTNSRLSLNNGTLKVDGDFSIMLTNENNFNIGAGAVLEMAAGIGVGAGDWDAWGVLEVGGTDSGNDPITHAGNGAGFSNNFDLTTLEIAAGASILLADLFDNGNRGGSYAFDEALYVDTLVFADGTGTLNLNGLNLYYNTLVGSEGQIINQVVPEPSTALLLAMGLVGLAARRRRSS